MLIAKKLLRDFRAGRVRGLLYRIVDPQVAPYLRPFFDDETDDAMPEELLEDIRGVHDSLMLANAKARLALRILEVAATYYGLQQEPYRALRKHLNAFSREALRKLPEKLCETCRGVDYQRCKSCRGKGYHTLEDLKLA